MTPSPRTRMPCRGTRTSAWSVTSTLPPVPKLGSSAPSDTSTGAVAVADGAPESEDPPDPQADIAPAAIAQLAASQ